MNAVATNKVRTPSAGLKILEGLYSDYPNHSAILNSLIHAYIRLGFHDQAIDLIKTLSSHKKDIQSLKFQAWLAHKRNDIEQERTIWHTVLDRTYFAQVHSPIGTLLLRSKKPFNLKPADIPLISVVRNEMLRLPFFLEYYRKLGVTQFIFVDNNSDDGSFEFLLEQADCHVFWTNDNYMQAGYGIAWLHFLINETNTLYNNQWCIIADADEFLVYPHSEKNKLPKLISYLNSKNSESVPSFMLDMYPKSLESTQNNSTSFIQNIYFYNHYHTFYQIESPYTNIGGGIRPKLFTEHIYSFVKSSIFKKTNRKIFFLSSTHTSTPNKVSDITTAFLHYKFVGDLKSLSAIEIQRKQHAGGASRYRHYYNQLSTDLNSQDLSKLSKSTIYKDSQQLIDLGLLNTTDEWDSYAGK